MRPMHGQSWIWLVPAPVPAISQSSREVGSQSLIPFSRSPTDGLVSPALPVTASYRLRVHTAVIECRKQGCYRVGSLSLSSLLLWLLCGSQGGCMMFLVLFHSMSVNQQTKKPSNIQTEVCKVAVGTTVSFMPYCCLCHIYHSLSVFGLLHR